MYVSATEIIPSYHNQRYLRVGEPINLFPDNIYGRRSVNVLTPAGAINFTGTHGDIIRFFELLEQVRKNKDTSSTETKYYPIEAARGASGVSKVQKQIASDAYKYGSGIVVEKGKKYYASGIMIFCMDGTTPSVILFNYTDPKEGSVYVESSGDITSADDSRSTADQTLRNTAIRETQEESANLFKISSSSISESQSVDLDRATNKIPTNFRTYRCYYIGIGPISKTDVVTNFNANKAKFTDPSWTVMNSVDVIPIATALTMSTLRSDTKQVLNAIKSKAASGGTTAEYESLCNKSATPLVLTADTSKGTNGYAK